VNGADVHGLLVRWKWPMSDPTQPTFSTATFAALLAAWWPVADPFLVALGAWVQAHSVIVFPDGYAMTVRAALEAAVTALAIRWHMGSK
jgi:hypothetical protein